jgi:hypothetical protein
MNNKTAIPVVLIITIIIMISTYTPILQVSNTAAAVISINTASPPPPPPVDCNSKKGTTNTFAGSLNYGGVKCEGQNGGTAAAGGIKSDSGTIGIHGIQTPNDNSHLGGISKR